jgi:phenylalanyl-tRNA synthetase beta subunit
MKISRNWLQTYFKDPLPETSKIAEELTMHSFEIEGVEKAGSDEVLDVKVLPNRAHDCLSHYGIAKEVSTILDIPLTRKPFLKEPSLLPKIEELKITVESTKVPRFALALVRNVSVGPSPEWLKERLDALGQKSINNIVDATNYVMFDLGQPLHAFDLDKLGGKKANFVVRESSEGEKVTTLDGKEHMLPEEVILITEGKRILGVAGVKGGKEAEIETGTKNIVLEAANFNAESIRKSSKLLRLRTDASQRFENNIARELPGYALRAVVELILDIAKGELIGFNDHYPEKLHPYKAGVSLEEVNSLLGTDLQDEDMEKIISRLHFPFERIIPETVIREYAKKTLGRPYKNPSSMRRDAPELFSCSSLVSYLYAQAGIWMPSISVDKYVYGDMVGKNELKFGDLVFSNTGNGKIYTKTVEYMAGTDVPEGVDHVAMWLGDGKIVHASGSQGQVVDEDLNVYAAKAPIVGFRRIVEQLDEPRYVVTVPFERLDIRIKEDLIEEIGRVYGLVNVPSKFEGGEAKLEINKNFYYTEKIRQILKGWGFSEVSTYAMVNGEGLEIANPIAQDKAFMRENLSVGLGNALQSNVLNKALLGLDQVKIFEIGTVWPKGKEMISIGLAVEKIKKHKTVADYMEELEKVLGVSTGLDFQKAEYEAETSIESFISTLSNSPAYESFETSAEWYKAPSQYPFVLRDVAVFVPENVQNATVDELIKKEAGLLLVRTTLFDEFKKEGKVSYAFRLVFQSQEKTLSDSEVNEIMQKVTNTLNSQEGFQVR